MRKELELEIQNSRKELAATYSRGGYTTTTIGNAAFDCRVRDGNGSGHSFMVTKKAIKERMFPENYTQKYRDEPIRELNRYLRLVIR